MRLLEALDLYLVQLDADGRSVHTMDQSRRHVRLFASWLNDTGHDDALDAITHEVLARFLVSDVAKLTASGRPRKPTSTNGLRSSLRCFFAYCNSAGYARQNAAALVRRARCGTPPPRALSESDQERLRAELGTASTQSQRRDRVLFELMLGTGLRLGSAIGLRVEDVDLEAREIRVTVAKSGREYTVYLGDELAELLGEWIGERAGGLLFSGPAGVPLVPRLVRRRLAWWGMRAGIARRLHPHRLRHSFGVRAYAATADLLQTSLALGHASVTSTAIYARVGNEQRLRTTLG